MRELFLLIFLSFSAAIYSQSSAIRVIDGDTFIYNGQKIRIANIDAPELSQPGGYQAKDHLSKLIKGQQLSFITVAVDKYGRSVCRVYSAGVDVGLEMVRKGQAFVYRYYCRDESYYYAEKLAKKDHKGVWIRNQIKPWDYRKLKH